MRELPAYYKSQDALAPDAAQLHEKRPGNLERDVFFELGNVEQAFADADLVREGVYNCPEVCQVQMEMHAAIAEYDAVRDRIFVEGNAATALGCVYGGATVCAWYPITPSTSVAGMTRGVGVREWV